MPTALEASFKDRITAKIDNSLQSAVQHMVNRLGSEGQRFSGYELDFGSELSWRRKCDEIDDQRDSIEHCALRQLHALTAICDASKDLQSTSEARKLVDAHLKMLVSKEVPNLAMNRRKIDGVDIWFFRKTPSGGSDDVDASPSLQASALMALVRCANATGQRDYFAEAENWFHGLQKVYPVNLWNTSLVSFHKSGIIWESLALVLSDLPAESSFYGKLLQYVRDFESFLLAIWKERPDSWSFASARALALRWQSGSLKKKKERTAVKKWGQDHVDRFLGGSKGTADISKGILERIGGAGYTCGPLQGLTSLAAVVSSAELVQVVLQLLEKDIDRYQVSPAKPDEATTDSPKKELDSIAREAGLAGAFFRDPEQMKMEKRTSFRVDDTVQCMVALSQALKTLEGIQGVVVNKEEGQGASSAATEL